MYDRGELAGGWKLLGDQIWKKIGRNVDLLYALRSIQIYTFLIRILCVIFQAPWTTCAAMSLTNFGISLSETSPKTYSVLMNMLESSPGGINNKFISLLIYNSLEAGF